MAAAAVALVSISDVQEEKSNCNVVLNDYY